MTDHADRIATIRRLGMWVPPRLRGEITAAANALEAYLAAGERERQQLRDALTEIAAEEGPLVPGCRERHALRTIARVVLAGEGDATPPEGDTTNG